ncbi:MAG: hypothetical protein QW587_11870 [Candidatus Bathyarchaeia archaeon]
MPREGYATLTVKTEVLDHLKQQAESKGLSLTALLEELSGLYGTTHRTLYGTAKHGSLTTEVEELIAEAVGRLREQLREELQESLKAYVDERLDAAWNS